MVDSYDHLTIEELAVKRNLCAWIIKNIKTRWADDPRAPQAEGHYQAEHEEICATIARKRGDLEPPNLVVGMKSIELHGELSRI